MKRETEKTNVNQSNRRGSDGQKKQNERRVPNRKKYLNQLLPVQVGKKKVGEKKQ